MTLTAKEICSIIKSCKDAQVTHFECGTVRIIFSTKPIVEKISTDATPHTETDNSIQFKEILFTPEKNPEKDNERDAIDELMISDPARYEELLARGDLIDEPREEKEND